jgi:hypothetical protein
MAAPRKIVGDFCEWTTRRKSDFDRRSFRWKKSGQAWVLVGCPRGKFRRGVCADGTRAHKVLAPTDGYRCPRGRKHVHKG